MPKDQLVDWQLMWRDPQPKWTSPGGRVVQLGAAAPKPSRTPFRLARARSRLNPEREHPKRDARPQSSPL